MSNTWRYSGADMYAVVDLSKIYFGTEGGIVQFMLTYS